MKLKFSGNGSRVILWIHGFCLSSDIWSRCTSLFEEDYKSVLVDLPGFGNTPLSYFQDLPDLANQLYRQVRNQDIAKVTLIGHSLGGYVAMELLRQYPDFCEGLVLFHASALEDPEERKKIRQVYLDAFDRFGGDFFLRNFHENLFQDPSHKSIDSLKTYNDQISVETLQQYTQAMKDRGGYEDLLLSDIPKMLICGAFDQSISTDDYQKMYNRSKNCELTVLPNSAHMGMLEEPFQASQRILSFIKELNPKG